MKKDTKTLIVLTPGFAASEADTTCLPFLQGHICAVKENFPDLEIIILAFQYPYFQGMYKWNGIEVISFDGRERSKRHRVYIWMQVWKKLTELNRKKNIIGLFSLWFTECALIGSYFGKFHKIKHRTWLCGQDAKSGNKYVRLTRPAADELIAMSNFLKREFYKNYNIAPAHVIPLGVEPKQFSDNHLPRNIDVLGVGSLIPLKQYDVFVKVVSKLKINQPAINAIIFGKGPQESKLVSLIESLNMQQHIRLAGEIPHDQVLQFMQQAKIFLHTSNYEGFGTVCLEALYAGAHVVSFTKTMDKEIAHWHHVNDEEEMVNKVWELLEDMTTEYTSICAYSARDVACEMMQLFGE